MTETTFTVESESQAKLLTVHGFLELLVRWADKNLDTIAKYWAMPGEGWEDSLRTALAAYAQDDIQTAWMDLGDPSKRAVYTTKAPKPKMADFVLNGTVAKYYDNEVIVEIKTQSLGRIKDFRNDFEKDVAKLDEVDEQHADCVRLAVGVFFTSDWTQSKNAKAANEPVENAKVSESFTEWLDTYDRVYFSDTYQPITRKAGTQTPLQLARAGTIHVTKGGENIQRPKGAKELRPEDVHELGIVYQILPSKNEVERAKTAAMENDANDSSSSDSVFEKRPKRRRVETNNK
ncbi:hypothetical protein [Nonomuraea gerenzanensis]|uniref:Uncharacterized protein n=1 Tax=Nonomuraea gerenzanensis TaxID=93944 RepID=A0A1M4EF17_9ACTN|nr:hypothetical protein [Nonomuraea gerenzanensis]UBU09165.1 hypothetical protein LCN96_32895 [Nonomuraea gerenzanensis]SBO97557.1 hypothetical protein BN4615_P7073 [Nonomuraea gerenzanensis]